MQEQLHHLTALQEQLAQQASVSTQLTAQATTTAAQSQAEMAAALTHLAQALNLQTAQQARPHNPPPAPKFNGEESGFLPWLATARATLAAFDIPTQYRALLAALTEPALRRYCLRHGEPRHEPAFATAADLQRHLAEAFCKPELLPAREARMSRLRYTTAGLEAFITAWQTACDQRPLPPMTADARIRYFTTACFNSGPACPREVRLAVSGGPDALPTMDALFAALSPLRAMETANTLDVGDMTAPAPSTTATPMDGVAALSDTQHGQPRVCYNCRVAGHLARDCPHRTGRPGPHRHVYAGRGRGRGGYSSSSNGSGWRDNRRRAGGFRDRQRESVRAVEEVEELDAEDEEEYWDEERYVHDEAEQDEEMNVVERVGGGAAGSIERSARAVNSAARVAHPYPVTEVEEVEREEVTTEQKKDTEKNVEQTTETHTEQIALTFATDSTLPTFTATVLTTSGPRPIRCLIDSGATCNVVSAALAPLLSGYFSTPTNITTFRFADGGTFSSSSICTNISLHLPDGSPLTIDTAKVCRLSSFDLLLGQQWLRRTNPAIHWSTGQVTIPETTPPPPPPPLQPPQRSTEHTTHHTITVVSATTLLRTLRKPAKVDSVYLLVPKAIERAPTPSQNTTTPPPPSIQRVVNEYGDLFAEPTAPPPPRPQHDHTIQVLPQQRPPFSHPFRLSPQDKLELQRQLEQLLDQDRIRPSKSPYGAPVLFVKKKDGTQRLCVDYRALNRQTVRDRYPLPLIDELLQELQGATIFSKLDLRSGYHQLRVAEDDVHKTAFTTHLGSFEWRVLPFGLTNAPATFQRLMDAVLGSSFFRTFCRVYLDDIIIFSKTAEDHATHLQHVLSALRQHQLHLHPAKCLFGQTQLSFVGHRVSAGRVAMEHDKLATIRDWPYPTTKRGMQAFLGLCNYYRAFIPNYATLTAPLSDLLHDDVPRSTWQSPPSPTATTAFNSLKTSLTSAPALRLVDPARHFTLLTDASDVAIGAILHQRFEDGDHPVAFASRKLTQAERNYSARDKELLAVVYACTQWRHYLSGPTFTLKTDHESLLHLHDMKLKAPTTTNKRIARWAETLADFNFNITHVAGTTNAADALTRREQDTEQLTATTAATSAKVTVPGTSLQELEHDPYFAPIITTLQNPTAQRGSTERNRLRAQRFRLHNGGLFLTDLDNTGNERLRRCVAGIANHRALFDAAHTERTGGHQGADRTTIALSTNFFWPRLAKHVTRWTRECAHCQHNKPNTQTTGAQPIQPLAIPTMPGAHISLDFLELPPTTNGHNNMLVIVDKLTRLVKVAACRKDISAADTADLVLTLTLPVFARLPDTIISDRDPRFVSDLWQRMWAQLGTRLAMTTAHRPQGDGQTERANRQILEYLRAYSNAHGSNWDSTPALAMMEFALNSHRSSATTISPYELHLGRHAQPPALLGAPSTLAQYSQTNDDRTAHLRALWTTARDAIRDAQDQMAANTPSPTNRTTTTFSAGDQVLLHTRNYPTLKPNKLSPPYVGPYTIKRMVSPTVAELTWPPGSALATRIHPVVNISQLKQYTTPTPQSPPPPPLRTTTRGNTLYAFDKIVAEKRTRGGKTMYRVRWVGYGPDGDTWEPRAHLRHLQDDLAAWEQSKATTTRQRGHS